MDIHRCRFVPYPPSTINALAFSHSHIPDDQEQVTPRLAVGRANGDIEIWNPQNGAWMQETVIRGGKDRSIDGLVWTQEPNEYLSNGKTIIGKLRLFSIGYSPTVTEWDLAKGRPLRQTSGNHGDIWCLAAQPTGSAQADPNSKVQAQHLIAGCTDGALVLYSTGDDNLQYVRTVAKLTTKKSKIVSVVFHTRNAVVAGCSDSMIRVYDLRMGRPVRQMSLGSGKMGGPKEIVVWAVKVLPNGNIVSGDSSGELKIWDGKTWTMRQQISAHTQDILSLAISFDGSMIFSGGMDRRTIVYKQIGREAPRWAEVAHRRFHTHDVKTMASLEGNGLSVVVSGGPDASPTVTPLQNFGMEGHRNLPFLAQQTPIQSSPRARLLMSWWNREVHIWRLSKPASHAGGFDELSSRNRKLVAKVFIKGEASITSATLNADGNLLAVSTIMESRVFRLRPQEFEEGDGLQVSKVTLSKSISSGARFLQFSPDGKWLCIISDDNHIALARLDGESSASSTTIFPHPIKLSRIHRQTEKHILLGGLGAYDRTITQVAFSSDSRILVFSDLAGYLDSWVLSGHEDPTQGVSHTVSSPNSSSSDSESDDEDDAKNMTLINGQHWLRSPSAKLLPKLPSAPIVLSFRPSSRTHPPTEFNGPIPHATRHTPHPITHDLPTGEDRLLIITSTSSIFEFSILQGQLTPWSRRNPTSYFPTNYQRERDLARGALWDTNHNRQRLWIWSISSLWMFDLTRDFPEPETTLQQNRPSKDGYKDHGESKSHNKSRSHKKRNRERESKHDSSGAGSRIADSILGTGLSRKMQKVVQEGSNLQQEEEEDVRYNDRLLARQARDDAMDVDFSGDEANLSVVRRNAAGGREETHRGKDWRWWTYQYRPMLGVVLIGEVEEDESGKEKGMEEGKENGGGEPGLEVAIVERPIEECELPPRYYGDQEWVKGSA